MIKITVEVTGADGGALAAAATRLNVPATELAAAAIRDLVRRRDESFEAAARHVLDKNRELYQRLA
jgi:hypothetical protein